MSLATELTLNFQSLSKIFESNNSSSIFLAVPTIPKQKTVVSPNLFKGKVTNTLLFRDLLMFLSEIVNSRFYRPDLWRLMDPVVTCEEKTIRMECFSSCASIYGRVDIDASLFENYELTQKGTTNVNFNKDFLQSLALLRPTSDSVLEIGQEFVSLETEKTKVVEEKVKLPDRWLKGFLQSQAIYRKAILIYELNTMSAKKLISEMTLSMSDKEYYLVENGTAIQVLNSKPRKDNFLAVSGLNRITLLKKLMPHILGLKIYSVKETGATLWVIKTKNATVSFGISASVKNGFSGEGEALRNLSLNQDEYALEFAKHVIENLAYFDIEELANMLETSQEEALRIIDLLSIQGILGYDSELKKYFYRVLPFANKINKRFENSKEILENNNIEIEESKKDENGLYAKGWVQGTKAKYYTNIHVNNLGYLEKAKCNCEWFIKHELKRGPCKHILALRFFCESLQ